MKAETIFESTFALENAPPFLRWTLFVANRFGVPVILLIAFSWYIVAQNTEQREERLEDAARLAKVNAQVLEAFEQNAAATTLQANAISNLNNLIQENIVEMRRYEDLKNR